VDFKYRADQVGSFLRPEALLMAREDPDISPVMLKTIEDQHILQVLARQKELGLEIFTDGEFRRSGFMGDFYDSIEGLDTGGTVDRKWKKREDGDGKKAAAAIPLLGVVVEPIKQTKRLAKDELDFLKLHSPGDIKMTLPTANQFPAIMYKQGISESAYPTYSDFLWDIVPIFKSEIESLVSEGVSYVQIDAPRYTYYIDPKWRRYVKDEMGVDPDQALDEAIRVDNACLEGARKAGVTLAIHLCRGNNRSQWYAEGGYDPIAEKLFNELKVDVFLLEYESERSGTFEPLRFVPDDKVVVLGLLSSKVPELESSEQIVRRIEEASQYLPLENLALSTQCGFASMKEGNLLTEDEQWKKVARVVDTARQVWKEA
jgi:5-methyltetrahydropteroyltriglutamate--homocysteine methyltransferase